MPEAKSACLLAIYARLLLQGGTEPDCSGWRVWGHSDES